MYARVLLIVMVLLSSTCSDRDDPVPACDVTNPVKDLDWLAAKVRDVAESPYFWVSTAKYESATVFIFGNCCPNCLSVWPVYNCSGDFVGNIGTGDEDIDPQVLKEDVVIWTGENPACNFD